MRRIDAKYDARVNDSGRVEIVNRATGEVLPEDEPLIVFRAKDKTVRPLIGQYRDLCRESGSPRAHIDRIDSTLRTFEQFAADFPDRMKTPD